MSDAVLKGFHVTIIPKKIIKEWKYDIEQWADDSFIVISNNSNYKHVIIKISIAIWCKLNLQATILQCTAAVEYIRLFQRRLIISAALIEAVFVSCKQQNGDNASTDMLNIICTFLHDIVRARGITIVYSEYMLLTQWQWTIFLLY